MMNIFNLGVQHITAYYWHLKISFALNTDCINFNIYSSNNMNVIVTFSNRLCCSMMIEGLPGIWQVFPCTVGLSVYLQVCLDHG